MKHLLLFFVLAAALMVQGAPLTIVKDHRSDYVIAVAENALPGPREAAKELQTLIRRATGAQLPIVKQAGNRKAIVLASDSKLPPEGFRIKTDKGNLYIWGHDGTGDPRRFAHTEFNRAGTWFGVNYITEKFLDFRHFFPGEIGIYLPQRKDLVLPEMDLTQAPKMVYRNFTIWYFVNDRKFRAEMDLWKRRCNLGESLGWYNNHMWRYILPPEKYVEKHPEWFAMLNGRRSKESFGKDEGLKICTSNLEALKEFARVSVERAKKQKTNYISITPNDGIRFCECPECTKDDLKRPDGSAIMSNRMFLYANRLAEMITKELPRVKIAMLAYSHYKEPPTKVLKLHPALEVMYVYNEADSLYHDPRLRDKIRNDMKEWSKRQKKLYFYNTPGSPIHLPIFNPGNMKKLFADLAEFNVTGYAIENFASFWSTGLSHYLYAKMTWDPAADFDALYTDALEKCYGKAAAPLVRKYNDAIADGRKKYVAYSSKTRVDYRRRIAVSLDLCWNGLYETYYKPLKALLPRTKDAGQKKRLEMLISNLEYIKVTQDLFKESRQVLNSASPSPAAGARVVQLAQMREEMLKKANLQHPDVILKATRSQESWYQLPFDPAMLRKQLVHKRAPWTTVAYGNARPRVMVIGKQSESGTDVKVKGKFSLRANDRELILNVRMDEPLMKEVIDQFTAPNSAVWDENCADIFFDPNCNGKKLIHLITNSKGTQYAQKDGVKKWQHKIRTEAKKHANAWEVTLFIPWEDLGGKPVPGTIWGLNVARVRKTVSPNEYSCWAPTFGYFKAPQFFGRVIF